jgi:restriction system protein
MTSKADRLRALAHKRQSDTSWPYYCQIGDFRDGAYECDHVSPYTKSAGNVDADVFLMLQDWSSSEFLSGPLDEDAIRYGHTPRLPTNRSLKALLRDHLGLDLGDTYGTNLFPFIKRGAMDARIPPKAMARAASEYALPQVEIVAPRLVICLGVATFKAMQKACGVRPAAKNTADAIGAPFAHGAARVWCQSHPGQLGSNNRNRGGVDRVSADWAAMGEWLRQ